MGTMTSMTTTTARVPDATQMRRYLEKGLSQREISEAWEADSGMRVTRAAIGMAMQRYGLTANQLRPRYSHLVPWNIKREHHQNREVKYLRMEARRRQGLPLTDAELRRLQAWLEELRKANAVVMYNPDTEAGFFWVHRKDTDTDIVRVPE